MGSKEAAYRRQGLTDGLAVYGIRQKEQRVHRMAVQASQSVLPVLLSCSLVHDDDDGSSCAKGSPGRRPRLEERAVCVGPQNNERVGQKAGGLR